MIGLFFHRFSFLASNQNELVETVSLLTNIAHATLGLGTAATALSSSLYTVDNGQCAVIFDCVRGTLRGLTLPHLPTHLRHSLPQLAHQVSQRWGFHFCWSWDWEWCEEIVGWLWFECWECGWPSWTHCGSETRCWRPWWLNSTLVYDSSFYGLSHIFLSRNFLNYQIVSTNSFLLLQSTDWMPWKKIMWIYFI